MLIQPNYGLNGPYKQELGYQCNIIIIVRSIVDPQDTKIYGVTWRI